MPAEFYNKIFVIDKTSEDEKVANVEVGIDGVFEIKRLFDTVFVRRGARENPVVNCYSAYSVCFEEKSLHDYLASKMQNVDGIVDEVFGEEEVLVTPAMEVGKEYSRYSEELGLQFAYCHNILKAKYTTEVYFIAEVSNKDCSKSALFAFTGEEAKKWNEMQERKLFSKGDKQ